jgi:diaminopimelate epimerase
MKLEFYKYQGTGNDFIIVDNREARLKLSENQINFLCDRRYGIGADGLMILENDSEEAFKMVYFNADGRESTMCGNGGRCLAAFAHELGCIDYKGRFIAVDGLHEVLFEGKKVCVKMQNVDDYEMGKNYVYLNTGSPHYVTFLEDMGHLDVITDAHKIRYNDRYKDEGTNVNFVVKEGDKFIVRTYERGVEDETLSCGTGATAVAISVFLKGMTNNNNITLVTKGGELYVSFDYNQGTFTNVWLKGPATFVYKGEIDLENDIQ